MNDKISQDTIIKALWAACDTFRGTLTTYHIRQNERITPEYHLKCSHHKLSLDNN